jgi:hypothetical protein
VVLILILHLAHATFFVATAHHAPFLDFGVVVLAIAALAAKSVEEGINPEAEIERYEAYLESCAEALREFDAADSLSGKILAAQAMEGAAASELRSFLRKSSRAKFFI